MKITIREILFSFIIISLLFGLGVIISRSILPRLTETALNTISAVKVEEGMVDRFDYIRRTEVGDFLAADTLKALDPVSISDIPGRWLEIKKVKERYTKHVHHHTSSDGKGHTRHWTTVSYSWDPVNSWKWKSDSLLFMGQRFGIRDIKFGYSLKIEKTIYERNKNFPSVGDIRYVYLTWPEKTNGLMIGVAKDKWYSKLVFKKEQTIKKEIEKAEKRIMNVPIIFWILWWVMIVSGVIGFYWFENTWLEDKKEKRT